MNWHRKNHYSMPETGYKIVEYAESQENYMAKSEQVVEFRGHVQGFKHSPPRIDMYKDHKVDHGKPMSFLVPQKISPHGSPRKLDHDHFSPKFRDEAPIRGKSHVNGYKNSPPHDYGKYNSHVYDTNDDEDDDVDCRDGVCVKKDPKGGEKPKYYRHSDDDYDHDGHNDNMKNGNGYVPPTYTHPSSTHQPRKDTYHDKPLNDTNKNGEKHGGNNGYSPFLSNQNGPMTTQTRKESHYETPPNTVHNYEKNKGNGYVPNSNYTSAPLFNYNVPMTTQIPNTVNHEKDKGNGHNPSPNYTGPFTTQPKNTKDTYIEPPKTLNNEKKSRNGYGFPTSNHLKDLETTKPKKETYSEGGPRFSGPPPIKTRDSRKGREAYDYTNENMRNSSTANHMQHINSPRKDDQGRKETIDSAEAKRRYGGVSVPRPDGEQMHGAGTIDSIEAARRYNGVFVRY